MFTFFAAASSFARPMILIGGVLLVFMAVSWVEAGAVARYEGERVAAALEAQRESAKELAARDAASRSSVERWREAASQAHERAALAKVDTARAVARFEALEASGEAGEPQVCGPEDFVEFGEPDDGDE